MRAHAFVDGNYRAGWALAVDTLCLNDYKLEYDEDEAFVMIISVADGSSRLTQITEWLADRTRRCRHDG